MERESNRIFYVYFCCIIIGIAFLNSCKAQTNKTILEKADVYFKNLNRESIQQCIDRESDLFEVIKEKKNKEVYENLMKSCEEEGSHYKMYASDTKKLLSALYKNESSDFIIVNMINPFSNRILISASTLTFSRKKNDEKVYVINNGYKYAEGKKKYEVVKDSSISGFNVEKKIKLIEDYLYFNKENSISAKKRDQSASRSYYVIAQVNGKYVMKMLLDYSTE